MKDFSIYIVEDDEWYSELLRHHLELINRKGNKQMSFPVITGKFEKDLIVTLIQDTLNGIQDHL